jgi:hypothetical protein
MVDTMFSDLAQRVYPADEGEAAPATETSA